MNPDQVFAYPTEEVRVTGVQDLVLSRRDSAGLSVLDLGCRTGLYGTALADAGARVVGIEGRRENLERIPDHPNATWLLGDVRDLSVDAHGTFDVVLCLGLLYHLDATDAVRLLRAMRAVTEPGGFAVIDTHEGRSTETVEVEGRVLAGWWYPDPDSWMSSIGNRRSFWFTSDSLDDALRLAGWEQIEHHPGVRWPREPSGRIWRIVS